MNGSSPLAALVTLFCAIFAAQTSAKTPGTVHCYGGWCHRVSTIDEMHTMVGQRGYLRASYYDDCRIDRFNACGLTSSGEVFRPDQADNAASPIFPDGTILLTYNPQNGNAAVLRVNSTGPYRGDRRLDVSRATAEKLGFKKQGVADLVVTVLKSPEPEDARYKKMRNYARVPGYIGKFDNFDAAHDVAIAGLNMELPTQTAALDDGLDPELRLTSPRTTLEAIPRIDVAAVPVREFVFASPPEGSARTVSVDQIGPSEPEMLTEALSGTLNAGAQHSGTALHKAQDDQLEVIAAIDQAPSVEQLDQQETKVSRNVETQGKRSIKIGASFDGAFLKRLAGFIEAARAEARLKSTKLADIRLSEQRSWSERVQSFVHDARAKARASIVQGGAIQRFTAELTLKARRYR